MKTKILSIIVAILCFFSCQDDFLQRDSLSQLSEGTFWANETDATTGVNAIYNALREFTTSMCNYGMLDDFSDISYQTWATGNDYRSICGIWLIFLNPLGNIV